MKIATKEDLEKALKLYKLKFHDAFATPDEVKVTFKFNWWNKWYKIRIMKKAFKELHPHFVIGLYPIRFIAI